VRGPRLTLPYRSWFHSTRLRSGAAILSPIPLKVFIMIATVSKKACPPKARKIDPFEYVCHTDRDYDNLDHRRTSCFDLPHPDGWPFETSVRMDNIPDWLLSLAECCCERFKWEHEVDRFVRKFVALRPNLIEPGAAMTLARRFMADTLAASANGVKTAELRGLFNQAIAHLRAGDEMPSVRSKQWDATLSEIIRKTRAKRSSLAKGELSLMRAAAISLTDDVHAPYGVFIGCDRGTVDSDSPTIAKLLSKRVLELARLGRGQIVEQRKRRQPVAA
jgi:hypothetical protein